MPSARHLRFETLDFLIGDTDPLPRDTAMLALAAAMVCDGHYTETANILRYVLSVGTDPEAVREAIVQCHLLCGFPRALNGLRAFSEGCGQAGVDVTALRSQPLEPDAVEQDTVGQRGLAAWRDVYRDNADGIAADIRGASPDMWQWVLNHAYGRVLCRPTLEPVTRELVTVAALLPLDVVPQLKAHINGALGMGAEAGQLWALFDAVSKLFDARSITDRAKEAFESVLGKRDADLSFEEQQLHRWD